MATLTAPGLVAEGRVWSSYATGFADLVAYFEEMEHS